ncbi:hypothetical protein L3X38_005074 [Prunus dulcis]|uniref:Integrase catalytic domain-containing protein n=1 Tax=Prunus dulcis TaxID=3755 RepID=A0AAD4ZQ62_PRUDU|nr:hypothetical protein L3X38_005074 [Prunus dulcis]
MASPMPKEDTLPRSSRPSHKATSTKATMPSPMPKEDTLPRRVRHRSARYLIINGSLYKRGFSLPYLRCLTPEEGHYVLREIHEGICGNHSGSRSLAHKAIRQGYFWPSLHTDAQAFTQKCDKCQRFANIPQLPAEPLTAMVSPWPFAQWGLDLIGPMPEGKGQVKYAVVAVDYFTKWAEAEALATITAARIESFVWQSIVCRFGIPNSIVTDNGRQFDNAKFKQFCFNLKIRLCFASPAHPQSNGQVEAVNKIIKKTLKTKLDKAKGCWPELLPEVLCSLEGLTSELKTKIARPLPNGKGHGQIVEEFVPLQHFNGPGSFEGLAPLRTPAPILSATCPDTQVPSHHVLTQLLACQLGGLGSALRLLTKLECSATITKLTSSQPRSYFSTANLGDYCLHHNEPSSPSHKATSTKATMPSPMPKEDTLPRCQTPAEALKCQT